MVDYIRVSDEEAAVAAMELGAAAAAVARWVRRYGAVHVMQSVDYTAVRVARGIVEDPPAYLSAAVRDNYAQVCRAERHLRVVPPQQDALAARVGLTPGSTGWRHSRGDS